MKSLFLIFIVVLTSEMASGQKNKIDTVPPKVQTKKQIEAERKNHECVQRNRYNFSNKLKNYPFNKASQIKIVSFLKQPNEATASLPKENDTICYSKLSEIRNLSIIEVDTLTDILYNIGFRGAILRESEMSCYEPRNAILFIDKNGRTFEYIEICFECEQTTLSSDKIILGDICNQKFGLIKKFFRKAGIMYGTNE
jgi:hypothetical protein